MLAAKSARSYGRNTDIAVAAREVTAVEEYQFRNRAHRAHLVRAEVGVDDRQHDTTVSRRGAPWPET